MATPSQIITSQVITASGAESGEHSVVEDSIAVIINVTSISGAATSATFSLQWSNDGVNFADVSGTPDALPAITAIGSITQRFTSKGAFYRLAWQVTGTSPSITVTIQILN